MHTIRIAAALVVALPVVASASLTARERACQVGRAHAVYDMIVDEAACVRRCRARAVACVPDMPPVASCLERAKARALRRIFDRRCERDCPECYGGCGPDVAAGEVSYSTGLVLSFLPIVYCVGADEPGARCADGVARASAWFARRYGRCFAACRRSGCDAATDGDAQARACADRAARRAAAAMDAHCTAEKPACHGTNAGADWTNLVRRAVDAGRPVIFCASASGAFVDGAKGERP